MLAQDRLSLNKSRIIFQPIFTPRLYESDASSTLYGVAPLKRVRPGNITLISQTEQDNGALSLCTSCAMIQLPVSLPMLQPPVNSARSND